MKSDVEKNERVKMRVMLLYCVLPILFGIALSRGEKILYGIYRIVFSPDTLITDYIAVGGYGAAFVNSGLLALSVLFIIYRQKIIITGPIIAVVFTVAGFGLFGKNIFNVWPVITGVWIYGKIKKENFHDNILIALFGTALSPIVSEAAFALGMEPYTGILMGIFLGLLSGIVLPPLSRYFVSIHQGYNIYNIGFTAGFVGMVFMSALKALGLSVKGDTFWTRGQDPWLLIFMFIYFGSMIVVGWFLSPSAYSGLRRIFTRSGRVVTDFVLITGFGASLINMGLMGILGITYVILVSGDVNGPTIGAVLTMAGFGAFGVHPFNSLPVMFGVFAAVKLSVWRINDAGPLLAALFSVTIAPISGSFGWLAGIVGGMLHVIVVMNVGYLHGGLNLYNNGFSGGIVATVMLPVLEALKEDGK